MPKSSAQGVAIFYGGVLKQSVLRLVQVDDLDKLDKQYFLTAYGSDVKGKFVSAKNAGTCFKKFKDKLSGHHQSEDLYTTVNVTEATKILKEIAGTEKATGIKLVEKEKKAAKGGKKADAKKDKKKKEDGSGSDSDSDSDSESESESDSDSGSDSDSESEKDSKKKGASKKPKAAAKKAAKKK